MHVDPELERLARRFSRGPVEFATSPLYGRLCTVAAGRPELLALLRERHPGVQPTNLLMAAVHHSLLRDPAHPLAEWFPSVGAGRLRAPETVEEPFTRFCHDRQEELAATIRTRLVQTNVVHRSTALRLALAHIGRIGELDRPVHLIEIGASAGILLRFDEYGGRLGTRRFGDPDSPVQLATDWRSERAVPDLDAVPAIGERTGIDLHPIDARDPDERRWLRALVWPENAAQAQALTAALDLVAERPVRLLAGSATDLLPGLIERIPAGTPIVIYHAATLAHVPPQERPALLRAIGAAGRDHPLFHISMEGTSGRDSRWLSAFALEVTDGDGPRCLAHLDGHGTWIEPA